MFDFTGLDYIYIAVLILSTVWATIRGGIYEMVATLSWVVAAFAARFVSPWLDKLLQSWFDLTQSSIGTLIASYFIVFFVILILVGFFNQKLREAIQDSMLKVTDRTLGIIFGIIRGVVVMGVFYFGALWYYSDVPIMPEWVSNSRTRPIMQLTAVKLDEWFVPGESKLLQRDMKGMEENLEIYKNLINPAVMDKSKTVSGDPIAGSENANSTEGETGYKSSERAALENQLLQIVSVAEAEEKRESQSETKE